jgi:membrane protein
MKFKSLTKDIFYLFSQTYKEWIKDDPFEMSASVAYYAILSLPALLIIVINIAGVIFGKEAVEGKIALEIGSVLGEEAGSIIQGIVANASLKSSSRFAAFMGWGTLIFGATGVFIALQKSINKVWEVRVNPKSGILRYIISRLTSFAIIVFIGVLIFVFILISTVLNAISAWLTELFPYQLISWFFILNFLVSFGIITLLFAIIYKYLPDVKIAWGSVWFGAALTSFLFVVGKLAMGFYFVHMNPASAYGAAGSLILIMIWISYSSLILFFGAEFTHVYAKKYGYSIKYSKYAMKMEDFYKEKYKDS